MKANYSSSSWWQRVQHVDLSELCQELLSWYLVVVAGAEEDAAASGVPLNQTHPSAVTIQLQHRLRHVAPQTALWDLPYSHLHTDTENININMNINENIVHHKAYRHKDKHVYTFFTEQVNRRPMFL